MTAYEPVELRLWKRVNKLGPCVSKRLGRCWFWTGACFSTPRSYGQIAIKSKPRGAHIVSWQIANCKPVTGITPKGKVVRHKCDNPTCVRPSHLVLGSPVDNFNDALKRGRRPDVKLSKKIADEIRANPPKYGEARKRARVLGISEGQMSRIIHGTRWR